ncbi:histidine triad nucleotide-binding protein 3 [Sergentomyia squamirostris]
MQFTLENCIFCRIVRKEDSKTVIEHETDNVVIFKDIRPAAPHHYLAVSKVHIKNCKELTVEHKPLLEEMQSALEKVLSEKNVNISTDSLFGFHWPPFTSIKHLHMHGMGPKGQMGFFGKLIFKPNNKWFCTTEYVMDWIQKQPAAST